MAATLVIAPAGVWAQDDAPPPASPELSEGAEMLSEGMKLLLRGLLAESAEGWSKLVDWLDDLSQYEPPERLPNGDIIIRRKPPPGPDETEI
ncbi:hypothetical protein GCM10011358_22750 [Sinisalibacter lacisalsi]|uniref:AAA+ family ATPase n=2 Tax=Sinisalibacter lacisalsi TaxID=1526570 RepID=A0ABQ1QQG7_9RHOB|nr:hypothetical protein GCM10011358_22750 [Sinisalibacter lacisalsi]